MRLIHYFLLITLTLTITGNLAAQHIQCCAADPTYAFAKLADDPAFMKKHDLPVPYTHQSRQGAMISYDTRNGQKANAFLLESKEPSDQWLVVVHEWWGLNDYIKKEAEKLYNDLGNINVIALDLYDGKVATTREDAKKYMQSVTRNRAMEIIDGAFDLMGSDAGIATIGWCFGGGWSLQIFIEAKNKGTACVMYYGMPETDIDRLKKIEGPVLGIFANEDQSITPAVVKQFEENMKKAEKELIVKQYDAAHAFANPSSQSYNSEAAKDAYKEAKAFLDKYIP